MSISLTDSRKVALGNEGKVSTASRTFLRARRNIACSRQNQRLWKYLYYEHDEKFLGNNRI